MKFVEKGARTVDEAVALAMQELGASADQVQVVVLEEARSGLFGFLSRNAVVRVIMHEEVEEVKAPGAAEVNRTTRVKDFLENVCQAMGVQAEVQVRDSGEGMQVDVFGEEAGMLIGHHGQTLDALQFLTNVVAARGGNGTRVMLDVEGYRRRREETLIRLAERLAERVRRGGAKVVLEPMSAHERRVIHMALADHPDVATSSEGEEPHRRVVILPKR